MITLSSSSAFTLVTNSIFACYILKERFTKFEAISITLISAGAVICVLNANFKTVPLNARVRLFKFRKPLRFSLEDISRFVSLL